MSRHSIKIVKRPAGAAPEWIRDQWIGLSLPLVIGHEPRAYCTETMSIFIGQRSFWLRLKWFLGIRPRLEQWVGYVVRSEEAVAALEQANRTEAAGWWRTNVSIVASTLWMFDAECCYLVPWNDSSPNLSGT